jgi:hypothetical protein
MIFGGNTHVNQMPKRISISLPDPYYEKLEHWAESEDRTIAGLASYVLQKAIDDADQQGKIDSTKPNEPPKKSK